MVNNLRYSKPSKEKRVAPTTPKNKINKTFNNNITDIEKSFKYNIQDGQVYKQATGEDIEIDPELIRDKLEE